MLFVTISSLLIVIFYRTLKTYHQQWKICGGCTVRLIHASKIQRTHSKNACYATNNNSSQSSCVPVGLARGWRCNDEGKPSWLNWLFVVFFFFLTLNQRLPFDLGVSLWLPLTMFCQDEKRLSVKHQHVTVDQTSELCHFRTSIMWSVQANMGFTNGSPKFHLRPFFIYMRGL